MEIDELITVKEKLLIILDSRNAIYLNGSFNSKLDFDFADNINFFDTDIIEVYCSFLSFTCPNSIYIINEYNNNLCMNVNGAINTYLFTYENYTAQTFINAFITLTGLIFSFNSITNTFTLTNNTQFSIFNTQLYMKLWDLQIIQIIVQ